MEILQIEQITKEELAELVQDSINAILKAPEPKQEQEQLLKISDVAKLFKVSKTTVHTWKRQGKIPYFKISDRLYFRQSDILQLIGGRK